MQEPYFQFPMLTDVQLVELARRGDQEAFGALVRRHRQKCVDVAASFLRNHADAEDQVQTALLKAYEHLDQYHAEAEFSTWLARIVVNQSLMLIRVRRRVRFLYLDDVPSEPKAMLAFLPNPEYELASRQMTRVLTSEIDLLPHLLRTVILLRGVRGLPMIDVAAQLGISVEAAKSRLVRARTELRLRMAKHYRRVTRSSSSSLPAAPSSQTSQCRMAQTA